MTKSSRTTTASLIQIAAGIADATSDAYSFTSYGRTEWKQCALLLLERGWDSDETANILRSKIMRWAADEADEYFRAYAREFEAFLNKYAGRMDKAIREAAHPAA